METKVIEFLKANGYKEDSEGIEERTFYKNGVSTINVCENEIVLIGEIGDWLHLPLNYYALIGALLHYRELACDYQP